jgi:hypothetical protein
MVSAVTTVELQRVAMEMRATFTFFARDFHIYDGTDDYVTYMNL